MAKLTHVPKEADFGTSLRAWRTARGQSQLALSMRSGVSTRHLSYLETGRASPSRDMVLTLGRILEIPLRERNVLLRAAGFASVYRETPLDAPLLDWVREGISQVLRAMEPNPTFVVDRRYDVLDANAAGHWLLGAFTFDLAQFERPYNMARLLASPAGMRPYVENWTDVARKVFGRLTRDLGGANSRDAKDDAIMREVEPIYAGMDPASPPTDTPALVVGVNFMRDGVALRLFTTIATLGTPLDVTLQELRIEMLLPADAESRLMLATASARSVGA